MIAGNCGGAQEFFKECFDIFSCCFELSARGGKLSVNQIQLLIYVFLKRWLINWIPHPGPYVNEITITKLSEGCLSLYDCLLRGKRNSK